MGLIKIPLDSIRRDEGPDDLISMSDEKACYEHLMHCSAEINTAVREGFYVRMFEPTLMTSQNEDGEIIDVKFKLNYAIEKVDEKRAKFVDLRDEMARKRNPNFQPPGGAS